MAAKRGGGSTSHRWPIGAWEPIKLMSGAGGGFFNPNSAHPFENPSGLTNAIEILLMLLVPTAIIRTCGRMAGNARLGCTLLCVVGIPLADSMLCRGT